MTYFPQKEIVCYRCQKPNHLARDRQDFVRIGPIWSAPKAEKPKVAGRVFAVSGVESLKFNDLVQGVCEVTSNSKSILFDSRATHSFISHDCVKRLNLSACPLSSCLYPYDHSCDSLPSVHWMSYCGQWAQLLGQFDFSLAYLDIILRMD